MDNSSLGNLPAELRNRISELALTVDRKTGQRNVQYTGSGLLCDVGCDIDDAKNHNQLTQTCRQLRAETLVMFYGVNNFHAVILDNGVKMYLWLETLGAQIVSRIRSLRVQCWWSGGEILVFGGGVAIGGGAGGGTPVEVGFEDLDFDEEKPESKQERHCFLEPVMKMYREVGLEVHEAKPLGRRLSPHTEEIRVVYHP